MKDPVLLLYSGGKDSFLAADKYASSDVPVKLISFNNGAVAAEKHLTHGAKRLQNKHGTELIEYVGVVNTSGNIHRLNQSWAYMTQAELAEKYPNVINAQLQCLHCQTAMWVEAIAYAIAKNIKTIAAGYHDYDEFCTGCREYTSHIQDVAAKYGITIELPVWDESEWQNKAVRDMEMMNRFFEPQVLEPKCLLGLPVQPMSENHKNDLMKFFTDNLKPKMQELAENMVPHFKVARIFETSLMWADYPDPKNTPFVW